MDGNSARVTLRADDVHVVYHPQRRRAWSSASRKERSVHAVNGVSLQVHEGEVIGIIGANGSGKSSFLTALAGLIPVERGSVVAAAYPALLGVRPAIRQQLSGRDNIVLGCLALGLDRKQVAAVMPEIVKFAGVADHVDLPLRTWSSGMKARLVFAISTSVSPKILLVDEVLAVGDAEFRRRSVRRLRRMARGASTVVMVSHKMKQIRKLCTRVIWLDRGEVRQEGKPKKVVKAYKKYARALAAEIEGD